VLSRRDESINDGATHLSSSSGNGNNGHFEDI
jgi:hypothetical protein